MTAWFTKCHCHPHYHHGAGDKMAGQKAHLARGVPELQSSLSQLPGRLREGTVPISAPGFPSTPESICYPRPALPCPHPHLVGRTNNSERKTTLASGDCWHRIQMQGSLSASVTLADPLPCIPFLFFSLISCPLVVAVCLPRGLLGLSSWFPPSALWFHR